MKLMKNLNESDCLKIVKDKLDKLSIALKDKENDYLFFSEADFGAYMLNFLNSDKRLASVNDNDEISSKLNLAHAEYARKNKKGKFTGWYDLVILDPEELKRLKAKDSFNYHSILLGIELKVLWDKGAKYVLNQFDKDLEAFREHSSHYAKRGLIAIINQGADSSAGQEERIKNILKGIKRFKERCDHVSFFYIETPSIIGSIWIE